SVAVGIDRLGPEDKRLFQAASVVGKDVPYSLLQAIGEVDETALRAGLARLQAAEFLYEVQLFPEAEYTFKHALTHEAAYGGLLQERRRTLHARIIDTIEALYPDRLAEQVNGLAVHAIRGVVWEKALHYCRQLGEKGYVRRANREAVTGYAQSLEALGHLPEHRGTEIAAMELRHGLALCLNAVGEHQRALIVLKEAETLARRLDNRARLRRVPALRSLSPPVHPASAPPP